MNKRPIINLLMVITGLIILATACVITRAWYVGATMSDGAVILSEPVEGLKVRVYRGYDYDLDGGIDEHLKDSRNKNDMNESYSYLTENDEVTEIIDNNYITYRLVISNDSSYSLKLNPYFKYEESTKQNCLLYTIDSISIYDHTIRNQDGTNIIDYDDRAIMTNNTFSGNYKTYSLTNGLFDTYGKPIYHITNGVTTYEFEYTKSEDTYTCTTVKKNGVAVANEKADLTNFYVSDIYDSTGTLVSSGTISSAYTNHGVQYNYLNSSYRSFAIAADTTYSYNMYPSIVTLPNKNLNLYMHEEYYNNYIALESFSEYYVDIVFKSSSSTQSIYEALEGFAEAYDGTYDSTNVTYDFDDPLYQAEYDLMERLYDEKTTNSSLSNLAVDGAIPFKIKYFCYDVEIGTEFDSYDKPAYEASRTPEVDI